LVDEHNGNVLALGEALERILNGWDGRIL